ncbi:MAG: hypothetical protein LCH37_14975, partial [Bacteroidetes bacterium]|nr:hypothetical protein [Bacteroidota bacterium]
MNLARYHQSPFPAWTQPKPTLKKQATIPIQENLKIMHWKSQIQQIDGNSYLLLFFQSHYVLDRQARRTAGSSYNPELKCWKIPDTPENRLIWRIPLESEDT